MKLRKQVKEQIGDRIPTHDDKTRCHYVMAFISETLRHSSVLPIGDLTHLVDTIRFSSKQQIAKNELYLKLEIFLDRKRLEKKLIYYIV